MKKMIGLLLVSGALLAVPSASSLQANVLETILSGESADADNDGIPNCEDPDYIRPGDGTGSDNRKGDGTGDGICDYL